MKQLLLLVCLLIGTICNSQNGNGGQSPEDQYVKIAYIGNLTARITNKQSCDVSMDVKINGGKSTKILVAGGAYYDISIHLNDKLQVKPCNKCDAGTGDPGTVEMTFTSSILPIKLGTLNVHSIRQNTFDVSFETYNTAPSDVYYLQLNLDNLGWNTIAVQFPDELQPNRLYHIIVEINSSHPKILTK